ncbi:MAG: efflux RND transporter permease subunit [Bacteroidota bacterium]
MRRLIGYFVRYPIWSNAIIFLFLVGGLLAYFGIKKSFFPETESRTVSVQVTYLGASPEEMETGVVLKVEEALNGIVGIDEINSVSYENSARIYVEGLQGYDPDLLLQDVKNAVDRINSFPVDAEKPVVYLQRNLGRAITLVLTGKADLFTLKTVAERVEDDFLAQPFMSQITVSGFPDREIAIEVSEEQLQRFNMTFDEVALAVRTSNQDITGGAIRGREEEILIRADGKRYTAEALEPIVIRTNPDGTQIRLRDVVSQIEERFAETPSKTLFNGENAVTINVRKLVEEDIMVITDWVKEYAQEFNERGDGLRLEVTNDQSEALTERLNLLIDNGLIGLVLVLIALGFFLNLRLSFWVAWGIPFSFLGMFFVGFMIGITINMISLFGMILVIGILVDDGIVVGENIFTHMEKGKSPVRAAIDGSLEVLPSVFTSVTTTIIIFCTFFFLGGRIGEFIMEMAIVVIASLAFSLVECTFVLPAHLAHVKPQSKGSKGKVRQVTENIINFLKFKIYGPALAFTLRWRYFSLAVPAAMILIIMGMFNGGFIEFTFFPNIEANESTVSLVLKPGTREDVTEGHLRRIEADIWALNAHLMDSLDSPDSLITSAKMDIGYADNESGGHTGTLEVSYISGDDRLVSAGVMENLIREKIGTIPEAEKLIVGAERIFGKPVAISLVGNDLEQLESANEMLKAELANFSSLKDIKDNKAAGKREVKLELKPQAYNLGLNHREVARQIRQGFLGEEVQRLQKGTDEVRVWVRYPGQGRENLGNLDAMRIKTATGQSYPFPEIADYTIERGIVTINHYNGMRELRVEADVADPDIPVSPLLAEIKADVVPRVLEQHPGIRVEYRGQEKENSRLNANAGIIYGSAFGLMFLLITLTFRSLPQALLIFPMIILGILGSVLGHWVHGEPLSILSSYGLLALSGIVVNDAVVLMAKFNRLIKEGMEMKKAAYEAGLARFRAILLTSITTIVGLYPLILAKSRQAQFLIPMAISVVYGVLLGTIFILIFFPTLTLMLNDLRVLLHWLWHGKRPTREEVEPARKEIARLEHEEKELAESALGVAP